jgi:hypothetical protein
MKTRLAVTVTLTLFAVLCVQTREEVSVKSASPVSIPPAFAATVSLGRTSKNKVAIYPANDSVTFVVSVVTSADVPGTATAKVDLIETANSSAIGYSVSQGGTSTKTLAGGGQSTNFSYTVTTNSANSNSGTINFQFKLDTVTGATAEAPQTLDVSITVQAQSADTGSLDPAPSAAAVR